MRIRGLEMLVFRKILRTYLLDDPLTYLQILVGHILKPSFLAIFFFQVHGKYTIPDDSQNLLSEAENI